jgi:hypothetical protein
MRLFTLLICLYAISCSNPRPDSDKPFEVTVVRSALLDSLSSGSGLVFTGSGVFVISDNMNGFFKLDTAQLRYSFMGFDSLNAYIQSKDIKEDFENAAAFTYDSKEWIIAFGSGSVANTREKILMIPLDDPARFQIIPAIPLYAAIKKQLNITIDQLNLEACFAASDSMYILNRGTNQSISFSQEDMMGAIGSGFSRLPRIKTQQFKLPVLDGYNASFSGAVAYKPGHFIFSATVEKTKNWVDDGEVAGSYIGLANIDGRVLKVTPLKDQQGNMIKEKIESVELVKGNKKASGIYAISDNDNGKSTWFVLSYSGLD